MLDLKTREMIADVGKDELIPIESRKRVNRPVEKPAPRKRADLLEEAVLARGRAVQWIIADIALAGAVEDWLRGEGATVLRDGNQVTAWIGKRGILAEPDWRARIEAWLGDPIRINRDVSTLEIAQRALGVEAPTHQERMRISAILRDFGYTNIRVGVKRLSQWAPPEIPVVELNRGEGVKFDETTVELPEVPHMWLEQVRSFCNDRPAVEMEEVGFAVLEFGARSKSKHGLAQCLRTLGYRPVSKIEGQWVKP